MALFLLIAVVMLNFAANSVLSRLGIYLYGMDPLVFSGIRLLSGAVMLTGLVVWLRMPLTLDKTRIRAALALLFYLVPFSLAYLTLPSGVGALILFGVVQITMFAGSALAGTRPTSRQYVGMVVALSGLAWLLLPVGGLALERFGVIAMVVAGFSWGVFSMLGRGSREPLADMAVSFMICVPFAIMLLGMDGRWSGAPTGVWGGTLSTAGVMVAVISGAVTSGMGYALWYRVLPQIEATTGAVAQLSVPVLAIAGGSVFLGEAVTAQVALASAVVLGGIGWAVVQR